MQALIAERIFDGESILENHAVVIDGGQIDTVCPVLEIPDGTVRTELGDHLLAPGFIDVQVNGGGGLLLNDKPDVEALKTIADSHRSFGTTAMLPTLISDNLETMRAAALAIKDARQQNIPGVIGVHFEGPYLNVKRKGVHDPKKIRPFEEQAKAIYEDPGLGAVVVTLAPELCPDGLIKDLSDAGIRVCAGHTAGTYDETNFAIDQGLSGFTHLFNAMTPLESRAPGVVGAALEDDQTWCGVIADGHHVHPGTLKVAIAAKQKGKMILVTDAMPSVGSTDKTFSIRGETIQAQNGVCATQDGTLAGSDLDMASAVRNTVQLLGQSLEEALRMASLYPASFLGMADLRGSTRPGLRADLVLMTDQFDVKKTWIDGQLKTH